MMFPKKILTFLTFLIISLSSIVKVHSIEPDIFIQSTVNRAAKTLSGDFTKDERIEMLKEIAKDTVDINGISLYTLGVYRKGLNEDQIENYKILFEQYFLKSFSSRLAEYSNPEIEVISKKEISKNYTMVYSKLVGTDQRPEVKIDWRIYTKNVNNPKIRDLIIEGLSLVRTQKEEFSSIIQSNDEDISALFTALKEFIK
jgi:phospholipid transport system substrate-binding protein